MGTKTQHKVSYAVLNVAADTFCDRAAGLWGHKSTSLLKYSTDATTTLHKIRVDKSMLIKLTFDHFILHDNIWRQRNKSIIDG